MALSRFVHLNLLRLDGSQLIESIERCILLIHALVDDLLSLILFLRHGGVGLPKLLVSHSRCAQHLPCFGV